MRRKPSLVEERNGAPINYNLKENGGCVFLFEKRNRKTFLKGGVFGVSASDVSVCVITLCFGELSEQ